MQDARNGGKERIATANGIMCILRCAIRLRRITDAFRLHSGRTEAKSRSFSYRTHLLYFFPSFATISCYCSVSSSSLLSPLSLALTEHIRHLWSLNATHYAYAVLVHIASIVRIRNDCSGLLRFYDYHIVITIMDCWIGWRKCASVQRTLSSLETIQYELTKWMNAEKFRVFCDRMPGEWQIGSSANAIITKPQRTTCSITAFETEMRYL